jgi:uncharacterized protein YceH (UPF0502 family)
LVGVPQLDPTDGARVEAPLQEIDIRVLGALIEKEHTTPDNYPLSLNALTAACNQATNRDPVMSLDEHTVAGAVDRLRYRSLVRPIIHSGGRVTKFRQLMDETMGLVQRQMAVLCVLMLRGPQTLAEIRTRAQRIHDFADQAELESTIDGLMERESPLVVRLPRRPGQKEQRVMHLLGGPIDLEALAAAEATAEPARPAPVPPATERLAVLESEVEQLRREVAELRSQLEGFRKQFE